MTPDASMQGDAAKYWEVITPSTGNTAAVYDTRAEAVDAAEYARKFGHEVVVVGFNSDGEAVCRVEP